KRRTGTSGPYRLPFQRPQYIAFGASLLAILIGFLVLSFESITLAPLLMVAGYCVGIPLALLWKKEHKETAEEPAANDTTLQTELTGG
ncbi:MAG: hypothetical protein FJY97_16735, partial [candidate division Zixibacteria bacterium]|nr:hypothetical protein [candidate division Zixibacteria bacterium]